MCNRTERMEEVERVGKTSGSDHKNSEILNTSYSGTTWPQYLRDGPVNREFDMRMNRFGAVEQKHVFVCFWRDSPQWATASSFTRFLDHTQRRTTVGRTPLDEWSARCIDLYLTTHNTHNTQTFIPPVGFELTISAGERPQTYALDRADTETGGNTCKVQYFLTAWSL